MRSKLKILKNQDIGITNEAKNILFQTNDDETIFLGSKLIRKRIK